MCFALRHCVAHAGCHVVLHMLPSPVLCCMCCHVPCCSGMPPAMLCWTHCLLRCAACAALCWPCCLPCCAGHAARRALLQALSCSLPCCTRCPVPCCPVLCCATCAACHTLLHMLPCCVTYDIKLYTATLVGQGFAFLVPCIEQV